MSGDAARDDARVDVLDRRQGQMLSRRDVAEEVCTGDGGERAADGCRDVVVARRDVRDERSEHVARRVAAEALLELHVRLDLVVRHVARSLDHDLDAALPGAVHELAERDELRELAAVRRVGRAPRAHAIAKADGHIVLLADVEDVIVVLVERVLHLVVQHPARDEGAAAAHDVHDAALAAHALDGAARDAAVQRHEVRAIFCLLLDRLEDVVIRHLDDGTVLADGANRRLIEWHRADHDWRVLDDALARDVDVVARREVHDGIGAAAHGLIELLELRLDVRERARRADVRVDLDAQALAAAMAAAGFCVMFNIPKRYIPLACLGAIITVDMRNILMVDFGTGMATASFIGAATLSLFLLIVARNLHAPVFVLTTPAIIPGVLLYRFLFAVIRIHTLTTDEFMFAMQNGVEAALVILGIALGATLPDVIAHQFIDRSKRERLRKILEERDGQEAVIEDAANLDRASERR